MKSNKKSVATEASEAPAVWNGKGAEGLKKGFQTAVKGFATASDTLNSAFLAAKDAIVGKGKGTKDAKKLLRSTLVTWATEAGIEEETAKSAVSRLFALHGLAMHAPTRKQDPEKAKAVQSLIASAKKAFPKADARELAGLFRAAMLELQEEAKA